MAFFPTREPRATVGNWTSSSHYPLSTERPTQRGTLTYKNNGPNTTTLQPPHHKNKYYSRPNANQTPQTETDSYHPTHTTDCDQAPNPYNNMKRTGTSYPTSNNTTEK